VLTRVDPLGNVAGANPTQYTWTYTYDAAGNVLTETDPLGNTTTTTYDAAGNKLTETDANNHTTTYTYNAANQLISVTAPDRGVTSYTYDDAGNKLTETDPRNNTTTYTYDNANRLISSTTALGNKTTYFYDANGNQTKVVDPRGNITGANPDDYATTSTYDAAGRLLTQTDALGHTTTYSYDKTGNRTSVEDANNHATSYVYDGQGRLVSVTAPDSGVTAYTYDANGNVLTRTDANNHVTTYTYDSANRLTSKTLPPNRTWTYSYDANGRLTRTTDANGNATQTASDGTTDREYDRIGRLTGLSYSDSTPDVAFGYDSVGNRTSVGDGGGIQTYTYDAVNRLAGITRGSDAFAYAYDLAGNVTSRSYPGSSAITYAYDDDDRLSTVTVNSNTTSYSYDAAGNLTATSLPSSNGYVQTRSYDRAGRLIEVANNKNGTTLSSFASTLDPVGNPITIARSGSVSEAGTYSYDVNDRLTSVCYQTNCLNSSDPFIRWTYDLVGSRLTEARSSGTTTYTYNAGDELTAGGSTSYSYDANGNQTQAGDTSFVYDLANRLASTTSGSTTTVYTYDGDGNRIQSATGTEASQRTNYIWDVNGSLPQIALERDGGGSVTRQYRYGVQRVSQTTNGSDFYYLYDALGSVVNVTSATGATEWAYSYEPFGSSRTEIQTDPQAPTNQMKFAGEFADPTGLYDLRARQYAPQNGRFLSPDPLQSNELQPLVSSYAYVADRPTVMVDPTGMTFEPSDAGRAAALSASTYAAASSGDFPVDPLMLSGIGDAQDDSYSTMSADAARTVTSVRQYGNGCGPGGYLGGVAAKFIPDGIPHIADYTDACEGHDRCYGTWGTWRFQCDDKFDYAIHDACPASTHTPGGWNGLTPGPGIPNIAGITCRAAVNTYVRAVRNLGRKPFIRAQLPHIGQCHLSNRKACLNAMYYRSLYPDER